jgi:hypothetical protein
MQQIIVLADLIHFQRTFLVLFKLEYDKAGSIDQFVISRLKII